MNKRSSIRSGLMFGILMAVFFIFQDLWHQDDLTTKSIITAIASGVLGGAVAGLIFGLLMQLLLKFLSKQATIETEEDENILFETPANHFTGIEAVGGKLYLTNKRLVFTSHKGNIQNHQLSIGISDIKNIDRYKTLGIIKNGLAVTTTKGSTEKFVVQEPGKWIDNLTERVGLQQPHLS